MAAKGPSAASTPTSEPTHQSAPNHRAKIQCARAMLHRGRSVLHQRGLGDSRPQFTNLCRVGSGHVWWGVNRSMDPMVSKGHTRRTSLGQAAACATGYRPFCPEIKVQRPLSHVDRAVGGGNGEPNPRGLWSPNKAMGSPGFAPARAVSGCGHCYERASGAWGVHQ